MNLASFVMQQAEKTFRFGANNFLRLPWQGTTYTDTRTNLHLSTTGKMKVNISQLDCAPTPFTNFELL